MIQRHARSLNSVFAMSEYYKLNELKLAKFPGSVTNNATHGKNIYYVYTSKVFEIHGTIRSRFFVFYKMHFLNHAIDNIDFPVFENSRY